METDRDIAANKEFRDTINNGKYIRQLSIIENALANLTRLDCLVSKEDKNGGLVTIARPFFEFLCCA